MMFKTARAGVLLAGTTGQFTFHGWSGGYGTNTLSAYGGERLVQAVEDAISADDVGQAVTVEICLQG